MHGWMDRNAEFGTVVLQYTHSSPSHAVLRLIGQLAAAEHKQPLINSLMQSVSQSVKQSKFQLGIEVMSDERIVSFAKHLHVDKEGLQ